ncbi:MAG: hypothetical protein ABIH69_00805 [bacterium]
MTKAARATSMKMRVFSSLGQQSMPKFIGLKPLKGRAAKIIKGLGAKTISADTKAYKALTGLEREELEEISQVVKPPELLSLLYSKYKLSSLFSEKKKN